METIRQQLEATQTEALIHMLETLDRPTANDERLVASLIVDQLIGRLPAARKALDEWECDLDTELTSAQYVLDAIRN